MCYDRVTSVYDGCVVTAFVEHTHVESEYVGKVDCTSGCTFIRADRHHMVSIDLKIWYML